MRSFSELHESLDALLNWDLEEDQCQRCGLAFDEDGWLRDEETGNRQCPACGYVEE